MLPEWLEIRIKVETTKSDLKGADLSHYKLMQAKLDHADLEEADLSFAYLLRADLRGANLREADLTSAVLSEADLNGADLTDAELTDAYLHGEIAATGITTGTVTGAGEIVFGLKQNLVI